MDIAIIIFPGTNRESDMIDALESVSTFRVRRVWHKNTDLGRPNLIILPGGFSYGDYLRCGAMAAHSPIMSDVIKHAKGGTPVLGVCNGFQMLVETQILPGALLRNKTLKFICRQTHLKTENTDNLFTAHLEQGKVLKVPVAHGEGNYFASDDQVKELEDNGQIVFRYCNDNGELDENANLNGSVAHIAGITNRRKTILGMMPHPENAVLPHQNTKEAFGHMSVSGKSFFKSIIETLAA